MAHFLRRPRRPSNGLLMFAGQSLAIGAAMILRPEWFRAHEAFNWLDCTNLLIVGGVVMLAACVQGIADAWVMHATRAGASSLLVGVYTACAAGILMNDPAPASILYSFQAGFQFLLAIRRI